jgi:hypothetical protein
MATARVNVGEEAEIVPVVLEPEPDVVAAGRTNIELAKPLVADVRPSDPMVTFELV